MEDAATAEISRVQIWQWQQNKVKLTNGDVVSKGNLKGVGHICFYNKNRIIKILKDWKIISINHILKNDIFRKSCHAEWEVIVEKK